MTLHADDVFAPLDDDHVLQRLAGGNETEVYKTDDHRHVVKVKHDLGGARDAAIRQARWMRDTAERYTACLGERYTIPTISLWRAAAMGERIRLQSSHSCLMHAPSMLLTIAHCSWHNAQ
jgi:hypothetical protein